MSSAMEFKHTKDEAIKMPAMAANYFSEPKTWTMIIGLAVIPLAPVVFAYAPSLWNMINV